MQLGHESDLVVQIDLGDLTYTDSQRKLGTTYIFRARAVSGLGASEWSADLVVNSVTSTYANTPTSLEVTAVLSRGFNVSWSMPADSLSADVIG